MLHPEDQALFPRPRSVHHRQGRTFPAPAAFQVINHASTGAGESFRRGWKLGSPPRATTLESGTGHPLLLVPREGPADSFRLVLDPAQVRIEAADTAGFQYAGTVLASLARHHPEQAPEIEIRDEPAFARRGFMLDISRNKVPTMATLFALVDQLAAWRFNHLQLYTEHTFAYAKHPEAWRDASPMTADEYRQLDAYCRARHIELAANQNSFGHLHRWLKLPAYRPLAESPDGYTTPWGERRTGPFSLNPLDPRCLAFLAGLYDELFPLFSSPWVNIGGDETFDLGQGASRERCEQVGKGRVYLDFLLQIKRLVAERGRRMMFWADIVLNHPELIPELPRDLLALVWGYEATDPLPAHCAAMAASGIPFWVCPGTSTWNSIAGRFDNAWTNIDTAARQGRLHGAQGLLLTEWGDNGHWQTQPFSRLALALGAGAAWNGQAPVREDLAGLLPGAETLIALAQLYREAGFPLHNTSPVFSLLRFQNPEKVLEQWTTDRLEQASRRLDDLMARHTAADDALWEREIQLAAAMVGHALRRGRWLKAGRPAAEAPALRRGIDAIIAELTDTWLARNRPGGLEESLEPLRMRQQEYGT